MAVFRVEKTKDFTIMSNYHLRDKNLSLKAKLADLNRELRQVRVQIKMCVEIRTQASTMRENIRQIEHPEKESNGMKSRENSR